MGKSTYRAAGSFLILALAFSFLQNGNAQHTNKQEKSIVVQSKQYKAAGSSPDSVSGKVIFDKNNCATCHSIGSKGGCLAPPLDGIGAYRSKEFIIARISDGPDAARKFQAQYGAELMPHLRVKSSDASKIVAYLMTLPAPKEGVRINTHPVIKAKGTAQPAVSTKDKDARSSADKKASIDKGRVLFSVKGCTSCHSINDIGGHFAPALDNIGRTRSEQYVSERINRAEFFTQTDEYSGRGSMMPPLNLSAAEIKSITDFLMSLPGKSK